MSNKVNEKEEWRYPWNGENHKKEEYNAPKLTNSSLASVSNELVATGKEENGKVMKESDVRSGDLDEGVIIKVETEGVGRE